MGTRFGDVWNTICVTHLAKKALLSFLLPFKLPNGMVDGCRKKTQQYEQSLQNYNLSKCLGSTTSVLGRFSCLLNHVT